MPVHVIYSVDLIDNRIYTIIFNNSLKRNYLISFKSDFYMTVYIVLSVTRTCRVEMFMFWNFDVSAIMRFIVIQTKDLEDECAASILAKGLLSDSASLVYGAVTLEEGRWLAQGSDVRRRTTWIGFH